MANASSGAILRHLRHVVTPPTDPRDDRELLADFATRRDHAAFAVLVRRHGAFVLNVCRRVLHHEQDAEDAFQAAFLVLATKAASLPVHATVPGFLHGIAYRLALKVRREAARRRRRELRACVPEFTAAADPSWPEVQTVLEEEIQRLPEKYRLPFALCHLEGLSRAEAGRQLRLKQGTVWSRLSQARALLQERLARRGIALAAVLGALAIAEKPIRADLAEVVVQGARQLATGTMTGAASERVAMLAQMGLHTTAGRVKLALAGLVALLAVSAGGVVCQVLTVKPPQTPAAPSPLKAAVAPKKPEAPRIRTDRHGDPLPDGAIARLGTVRWRHGFMVGALAYSPNGKMIAAVGGGRALTLWDAATGKELRQFPNINQPIGLAFSPDGKLLATTDNPYCYLWDVATGKEVRRLKGHKDVVRGAAFSADGKLVATAGSDGTVRLWDPATGEEQRRMDSNSGEVCRLAYSPDGKWIASTYMDGTIRLWDPTTGKESGRLTGHKKAVWAVVFSPDSKRLASSSDDGTIRLWNVATGRPLRILAEELGEERPIAFSPDGLLLAAGCRDGTIRLWDVASGAEKRRWSAGTMSVRAIAFSPDKTVAAGTAWDGGIRLWDAATGKERHPFEEHHGFIDSLRFSADNQSLISIGRDRRVLWWDVAANRPRHEFTWTTKRYSGAALSPEGTILAVSGWPDSLLRLWDVRMGKPIRDLGKPEKEILWAIAFSPDGRLVASGRGKEIHVWSVKDGKEVQRIETPANSVQCLRFSPDGKALACGMMTEGNDPAKPSLYLWDVASGKEVTQFDVPIRESPYGTPLAFSPDGRVLASSAWSQNTFVVRLWDTATGQELCRHTGHREEVGAIAFSPDGKLVASGAGSLGQKDNSVQVWEASTGRLIRRFEGHHSCIGSVTFAPDGLAVASGAGDSTILLWDITGRRTDGRWHGKPLTPHELDDCWTALMNEDATKAYDAVWALVAAPEQAVPFLQKHLPPVPRPDAKTLARLIAGLESDDFKVRQKATDELTELGETAIPALRQALAQRPELEVRRRVQQLLEQARGWNAGRLREHRAIQALEHLGSRPARQVLEAMASGAAEARRTEEAKAALRRLAR
jgi:RNA polymerase sigma factor (sigma-70 family)